MAKSKGATFDFLPAVVLYREDIESLLSIFHSHCREVCLSNEKDEYDSVVVMKGKAGSKPSYLEFRGSSPEIWLTVRSPIAFDKGEDVLVVRAQYRKADELYFSIKDLLTRRRRSWPLKPLMQMLWAFLSAFALFLIILASLHAAHVAPRRHLGFMGFIAYWVMVPFFPGKEKPSYVSLEYRCNGDKFWGRNHDEINKMIMTAVICTLVTWLLDWALSFIHWSTPHH